MYIGNHHTQSGMMGYHARHERKCIQETQQLEQGVGGVQFKKGEKVRFCGSQLKSTADDC